MIIIIIIIIIIQSIDLLACLICFPNSDHVKQFSRVRHYHMVWNRKTNPNKLKRSIWEEYIAANQRDYKKPLPGWPKCLFQSVAHGFWKNQIKDQLPVGLLARMVERCTGIAEVKRSLNSVQAYIISDFFLYAFAKVVSITEMIFFHLILPHYLGNFES